MADDKVTQTGNTNGAPSATTTATPAPSTTTDTKTTTDTTSGGAPKDWTYNGDRKSVPDQFKNYAAGFDRYWTQKSQAFAENEKKAKEYDGFVNSEDWKAYQQLKAGNKNPTGQPNVAQRENVDISDEEMENIMLGDKGAMKSVVERQAKALLAEKEKEFQSRLEPLAQRQKEIDASEMVKQFAELHPDFWELYEGGHSDYMLTALRTGGSLEDAYNKARQYEAQVEARLEEKNKKVIEEKRKGTTTSGTTTGVPDVVYATDERHARRLAIEMAIKNDPRSVQIKK